MSLFSFGNTNNTQNNTSTSNPQISVTGAPPNPSGQTSSLFSFGSQPTQNGSGSAAPPSTAQGQGQTGSGTSLFGNLGGNTQQQQQQPAQQPAAGGSSLFGGFGGAQQGQQPATGGTGLFGNLGGAQQGQQQQQQQPAGGTGNTGGSLFGGGGLFGNKSTTAPGAGGSSLFGQPQQQQPQQQQQQQPGQIGTGLFGQPSTTQQGSTMDKNLFGQAGQSAQQNSQNQQIDPNNLQASTKFTDLPEAIQKELENYDRVFKEQKAKSSGFNSEIGKGIQQTLRDVEAAEREYSALKQSFEGLAAAIIAQSKKNREAEGTLKTIAELVEAQRAPDNRSIAKSDAVKQFPGTYFEATARQLEERVYRYKTTISQLRRAVESLAASSERPSPEVIGQTIQNHQNAMLTLAGQINDTENKLAILRSSWSSTFQDIHNTARDPFELRREELGRPPRRQ